ncbi:acyl-CoA thioesterase [Lipingzhangella halophila]|uniref:Acyl-CoA thioesterase n=1 Tax=Lipingzhangella halophila TaxID=1783352 RepID=A0A7W7RHE2_9ACTN|nr:thioesterase family protein [Lipingzhangella halophila]MBB4931942.1 acyl-CoA thioesterase [Lipingzhangella halophila]
MSITGIDAGSHTGPHPFDVDTRTHKGGDGQRSATVSDRWTVLTGNPNGGYLLAMAVNALREDIGRPIPLVASGFFLRPASPGPATLATEVVREGRRTATGQVHLAQGGKEVVRATATFGDLGADTVTHTAAAAPDLPPPETCEDPLAGLDMSALTMLNQVEYRTPKRPGWMDGAPEGRTEWEFWMRLAGRDADVAALPMLVDAGPPVVLDLGEAGSSTVELTVHVRARPAPGWLACRAVTRHVSGGFHEEDFEIWDSTRTLVAQSRQFAILA